MEAAANATVLSKGRWWMVSKGKQMRRLTVIVLLNQCWGGMTPAIRQRWDNLINKTNELIAVEEQTRQTQLFRVARLGVNAAISRNERRIEIIERRQDLTNDEVLDILGPQLMATLGTDYEKCWVEGEATITLVAKGVPVTANLDNGDKLNKAMNTENPDIVLGFREPVRLGVAKGAMKAMVVKFEVYKFEDAVKLVKEGIKVGGKVRTDEEYVGYQGQTPPPYKPSPPLHTIQRSSGAQIRCIGCPSYRNGALVHNINTCPLRNEQK